MHGLVYHSLLARGNMTIVCLVCLQLSGAAVAGGSSLNEWQKVVLEVNTTLSELEKLKSSCIELCGEGIDMC